MKPSKRFVASKIDGADVHAPDGRKFQIAGENSKGYILERKIFDKDLAVESAKSGTDIMMKTTVKDLIIRDGKVCGVVAEHMGKSVEIEAELAHARLAAQPQPRLVAAGHCHNCKEHLERPGQLFCDQECARDY